MKKALSVVLSVVLWVVIIIAAFFAFTTLATRNSDNVASLGGFTPLTVATESMSPTFNAGDMIIIKRVDPATLQEGDIITFHTIIQNRYALNTHRIESITVDNGYRTYVTKGDNNAISDQHIISDGDIVGKFVMRLAGVGKLMNFLGTPLGFFLIIVIPMLAFFIYQLYHLIIVAIRLKKAAALEAAEEAAALTAAQTKDAETEAKAQAAEAQASEAEAKAKEAEAQASEAEAKAKEAEAKAKEAEERLAELERLKAEYEAKIAEAEKLKEEVTELKNDN